MDKVCNVFESKKGDVYFVELEADLEERLGCNKTNHRLEHKQNESKTSMEKYRLNSIDGEITQKNYIRINNANLSPAEVAKFIKEKFQL